VCVAALGVLAKSVRLVVFGELVGLPPSRRVVRVLVSRLDRNVSVTPDRGCVPMLRG